MVVNAHILKWVQKTSIPKVMDLGDQKWLALPKTWGLEFSSEHDLPLGTTLPPQPHKPPPAMITPEILHGSDLRTWGLIVLSISTSMWQAIKAPFLASSSFLQTIVDGTYKQLQMSTHVLFPNRR